MKSVIQMEGRIELLATTAREPQAKIESLTKRVIRLEAQMVMLLLRAGARARRRAGGKTLARKVSALIDGDCRRTSVAAKSAATTSAAQYANLLRFREHTASRPSRYRVPPDLRLIHGGERASVRQEVAVIPWNVIDQYEW